MREHLTTSKLEIEKSGEYLSATCNIHGEIVETERGEQAVRLDLEINHNLPIPDHGEDDGGWKTVTLSYLFKSDGDAGLEIEFPDLPRLGDPATDYILCVAGRIGSTLASTGLECYRSTQDWRGFLKCMRDKADSIAIRALWALFRCLKKLLPI